MLRRFLFLVCNCRFFFWYIFPLACRGIDDVDEFDDDDDEFDNVGGVCGERITLRFLLFCRVRGGGTKRFIVGMGREVGGGGGGARGRGRGRGSSVGTVKRY